LGVVAVSLHLFEIIAQEAENYRRSFDYMNRVDVAWQIRVNNSRRKPMQFLLLERSASRFLAVIGAPVERYFRESGIGAIDHPAWTVIMRRIAVTLRMDMSHLDKAIVRIPIKFLRRFTLSDEFSHPRVIRAGRCQELLYERLDLERELGIFPIAPDRSDLSYIPL
jgi:hypothetical protein